MKPVQIGIAQHQLDDLQQRLAITPWPEAGADIDGATVHRLPAPSPEPSAVPLLFTHSWPGPFVEYLDVIGPLTDPRSHGDDPDRAFHLVIPTIPGFGFSGPTRDQGWGVQ